MTKRRNAGLVCKEGITNRCSKNFRSGTKFLVRNSPLNNLVLEVEALAKRLTTELCLFIDLSLGLYTNIRIVF